MPDNVVPFKPRAEPAETPPATDHPHMPDFVWQCNCGSVVYYLGPKGHVCFGCGHLLPEYPAFG